MPLFTRMSDIVLELVRLSRDVLTQGKDNASALDRLVTQQDAHFKVQAGRMKAIEAHNASIAESLENSDAIARVHDQIYVIEERLRPIVELIQMAEDKLLHTPVVEPIKPIEPMER